MTKKAVLGRGLSALMEDAGTGTNRPDRKEQPVAVEKELSGVSEIAIANIEANPDQPRKHFNEEALHELSESIKNLGVIQPITVRHINRGKYQILSGERRYRAARLAGLETIPAFVRSTDDEDVLMIALVENIQREDLDAIEIAMSYHRLMEECRLTQEEMSERVGKKRSTVANYLRLLQQPAEVQAAIRERKIGMGHARAIAGLTESKEQIKVVRKTIDESLSVRQVEELVKKMTQPKADKKQPEEISLPEHYAELVEVMERYFNSTIAIKRSEKGSGSITIHFANDGEINDFLARLNSMKV
jgi:ParB family chromosome partitioning protein